MSRVRELFKGKAARQKKLHKRTKQIIYFQLKMNLFLLKRFLEYPQDLPALSDMLLGLFQNLEKDKNRVASKGGANIWLLGGGGRGY